MLNVKRFVLRLPDDMHTQLVAWAKEEKRSLHGLLIWIIDRALNARAGKRD